jgi:Flp pilus assembly protein TadD
LQKYDEALPYFDQVLSINASDVYAINNKAEALAEMGKNEEALSVIEKTAIDNPNDEYLQSTMAFILTNMGKDDEARAYYEKALKINSNLTEILYEKELDVFNKVMGNKTTE